MGTYVNQSFRASIQPQRLPSPAGGDDAAGAELVRAPRVNDRRVAPTCGSVRFGGLADLLTQVTA